MQEIKTIGIIGVGLIGGSIGLGLKDKLKHIEIVGVGRNEERLKQARDKGCIDRYTTNLESGVKDVDILIVSTPVELTSKFIKESLSFVKNDCIITDVASVKRKIISDVYQDVIKYRKQKYINFIGAHPIAGSEKTGFEYATKDLFKGSVCVVCYDKKFSSYEGLKTIRYFWQLLGAKVKILTPQQHDIILASTSHMLHLISYALVKQINTKKNYVNFTGGAYRDMTRIASSNPELWINICNMNKDFVEKELEEFKNYIEKLQKYIRDVKKLKKFLISAHKLAIKFKK